MLSLPLPVSRYFDANTTFDIEGMLVPFAEDAVVFDERQMHRGPEAIRRWIEQATVGNQAIAVPEAVRAERDMFHVTARVSGSFPGSPADLTFHFRLADSRIAELVID